MVGTEQIGLRWSYSEDLGTWRGTERVDVSLRVTRHVGAISDEVAPVFFGLDLVRSLAEVGRKPKGAAGARVAP